MSSPSDVIVIGGQVIAASQQDIAYRSYTKCSAFEFSVESNLIGKQLVCFWFYRITMRHPKPGGLITTGKISIADIIEVPVKISDVQAN